MAIPGAGRPACTGCRRIRKIVPDTTLCEICHALVVEQQEVEIRRITESWWGDLSLLERFDMFCAKRESPTLPPARRYRFLPKWLRLQREAQPLHYDE